MNFDPKQLTKGQQIGIGFLAVGVAVFAALIGFLLPRWRELVSRRNQLEEVNRRLGIVDQLITEQQSLSPRLQELQTFYPDSEEDVAEVAQKLERLASEAGVTIHLTFEDFPNQVDIGGRYQPGLGLSAEVQGLFQGVVAWMRGVQQLPYFIQFIELKMGTLEDEPGVRASFEGVLFLGNKENGN